MGQLIREKDWGSTKLGTPDKWPGELGLTLGIILNSKFPMLLFWGEDMLCFYNDAFRPSLGNEGKHPVILGKPAKVAWKEVWPVVGDLIEGVIETGTAVWRENQLVPIYRNGQLEDVYWTFSYSPVNDDKGIPQGVFIACTETTSTIESKTRLELAIEGGELATWDLDPETQIFQGSERLREWHGIDLEEEIDMETAFTRVRPEDRAKLQQAIANSLDISSGGVMEHEYTIINPHSGQERRVMAKGKTQFDINNNPTLITGILQDITEEVNMRKRITDSKEQLQFALEAAELGTWEYNPITQKFTANQMLRDLYGLPVKEEYHIEEVYKLMLEPDRELIAQAIEGAMDPNSNGRYTVEYGITNPKSHKKSILRAKGKVTFDANSRPIRINGTVQDITRQIKAKRQLEEQERNLRLFVLQAPMAIAIFKGPDFILEIVNKKALELWGRKEEEVLNQKILEAMPELKDQGIPELLDEVYKTGIPFSATERPVNLLRNGNLEEVFINFTYDPLYETDGQINGIIAVGMEVTEQVLARKKIEESEQSIRALVESAPFPIAVYTGPEMRISLANKSIMDTWGKGSDVIGKTYTEILPELEDQDIFKQVQGVFTNGKPFHAYNSRVDLNIDGEMKPHYFNYSFTPLFDSSGNVYGVMNTAANVTELQEAKQEVEEMVSELKLFKYMADNASDPLILMREDGSFAYLNDKALEKWGYTWQEVKNLRVPDVDPIYQTDRFNAAFKQAQQEVLPAFETLHKTKEGDIYPVEINMGGLELEGIPYLFAVARDIRERKKTEQELQTAFSRVEESEKRFRNIVEQAPMGITILTCDDYIVEMANQAYLELIDKKEGDFVGHNVFEALPEVRPLVEDILLNICRSGKPYYGMEFYVPLKRQGKIMDTFFNFVYHPLQDQTGKVTSIIVVATEVTDIVKGKLSLQASEKRFRDMVMQSPIAMTILRGKDMVVEIANMVMTEHIWKRAEEKVVGRKLIDIFPELKHQKYPKLLLQVYNRGEVHKELESEALIVDEDEQVRRLYLDFEYSPLFEAEGEVSGIMVTANDVTERVEARKKVEDAETRLRLATEATELATWELDLLTGDIIYSKRLAEIFGHPKGHIITHSQMRSQIHPEDLEPLVIKAFDRALKSGAYLYEARMIQPSGAIRWIRTQGKVFFDQNKKAVKMIGTLRDITEERLRQQELQESEEKFRLLADSMPHLIWTADPSGMLNYFNQAVFDYSGLKPEQVAQGGWLQIVHPDDREENVRVWTDAVNSGRDFLFEHRFRRYDGDYHWYLSRALPQKDKDGNIQMWVGSSTDIQDHKVFAQELEKQVNERTKMLRETNDKLEYSIEELQKMNNELQSFAYVSSHDMQEPLRKIQTFASRILEKEHHKLSSTGQDYFRRMQDSAERMRTLIDDLLAYSRTNNGKDAFKQTDLLTLVKEVKKELKEMLAEKKASIVIGDMCHLQIIPFQIKQLLHNLIGNSLKFAKPDLDPVIEVYTEMVSGKDTGIDQLQSGKQYCLLTVKDNGIGFKQEYGDRIFQVFQRLHAKHQYKGTGIGLAIVKKIVENHRGYITAVSEIGAGASFHIYLPVS